MSPREHRTHDITTKQCQQAQGAGRRCDSDVGSKECQREGDERPGTAGVREGPQLLRQPALGVCRQDPERETDHTDCQ